MDSIPSCSPASNRVHHHVPHYIFPDVHRSGCRLYIATVLVLWLAPAASTTIGSPASGRRSSPFFRDGRGVGIVLSRRFGTNWSRFSVMPERGRPADRATRC